MVSSSRLTPRRPPAIPGVGAPAQPFGEWEIGLLTACALFMAAMCWSPILPGVFHFNAGASFLIAFTVYAVVILRKVTPHFSIVVLALIAPAATIAMTIFTQSSITILRGMPLPLVFVAAHLAFRVAPLPARLCSALSVFAVIAVALSIAGFLYALFDGEPLLSFENFDGRENALYLSTLSNNVFGTIIRPSFIYDEAGALSFFLSFVVAFRELLGRRGWQSYFIMIGGLITFSLTHLLLTLIFLAFALGILRTFAFAAALAAGLAAFAADNSDLDFLVDRFAIDGGRFEGDNRSQQLENFAKIADWDIFWLGDFRCYERPGQTCDENGDISSSPATPLYKGGVMFLLVQLATHLALLWAAIKRPQVRYAALAMTLLVLQRPYFSATGYGFMIYLSLFAMYSRVRPARKRFARWRRAAPTLLPSAANR